MIFILLRFELLALILHRSQCYGRGYWETERFMGFRLHAAINQCRKQRGLWGCRMANAIHHNTKFKQPQQQNMVRDEPPKLSRGGISTMELSAETVI